MYFQKYLEQLRKGRGNPLDIIWCTLRYGASPNNYYTFDFENLTAKERSTYVTNRLSRKLIKKFNDEAFVDLFEDKARFAKRFEKYFKRKWIATKGMSIDSFFAFVNGMDKFIYKPIGSAQGQGIIVYENCQDIDTSALHREILSRNEDAILEEWIQQHPFLASVYGDAINCLRILTVNKNNNIIILAGGITWGNGKKIANASASGIVSPVDFSTGMITKPAADLSNNVYIQHPITGANLVNIQIPYWNEVLEMVKSAALEVPEIGYVGWDIGITSSGPVLIEGNTTPGYKYYQIPAHMDNHCGNRRIYVDCLK